MIYNINPEKWGKHFWKTIHYITYSAPDVPTKEYKMHLSNFFESLKILLPCENCRHHYSINLKENPLTDDILSSKSKLIIWGVNLHNKVNKRLGKKIIFLEEANNIYLKPKTNYVFIATTLLSLTIIIIIIIYIKFIK